MSNVTVEYYYKTDHITYGIRYIADITTYQTHNENPQGWDGLGYHG